MSHEDCTFVEAATSRSGNLHEVGTEHQTASVPHGLPTIRPADNGLQIVGIDTYVLIFEQLNDYLEICPLRAYLHTWRGKAFLVGPAIYWTVVRGVPPQVLHVLVEGESYQPFIDDITNTAGEVSVVYGVGDSPHAELMIDESWRIKVSSMGGFPISRYILEEPIGVAAMYWDLDTVWASDLGRLAVQYGANVVSNREEFTPDDEALLIECFEQGVPIVLPDTDAQRLIDADGKLATVRFVGLDGPCACGLRATSIVHLRGGDEFPLTRHTPSTAITDYNVWAHRMGCQLYGGASRVPTLDLDHMISQAGASSLLYAEPVDGRGIRNAVRRRYTRILEDPSANFNSDRHWPKN